MKKRIFSVFFAAVLVASMAAGCQNSGGEDSTSAEDSTSTEGTSEEKKTLVYGESYGVFTPLFEDAVKPILEEQGYTFEKVNVDDVIQNDQAIMEGDVDFNVEQHGPYVDTFNEGYSEEYGGKRLYATELHLPTLPYYLFSDKYESLDEIEKGAKLMIGVPNDGSNLPRALGLCADAGLITVDESKARDELGYEDITGSDYEIEWNEMDTSTIPTVLEDLDFGLITGSNLVNTGMNAKDAFICETSVSEDMQLRLAVREEDKDEQWVKDIEAAYQSDEFKAYMQEHQADYSWIIPEDLQ